MVIIKEERLTRGLDARRFNSVRSEVVAGEYEDWKRDKVDDAKKRAIYTAPSYDQFEALVKGCT